MLAINFLLLSRRNKTIFIYQELERTSCAHYFDQPLCPIDILLATKKYYQGEVGPLCTHS